MWFTRYVNACFIPYVSAEFFQVVFKTKIVRASEMDFSEARIFDEEDRVRAAMEAEDGDIVKKTPITQHIKNLMLG